MINNLRPANLRTVKRTNTLIVLDTIRRYGPISRTQIAQKTNLKHPTISNITAELIKRGLIKEGELGKSSGGRKPIYLLINSQAVNVIGLHLHSKGVMGVFCDFGINLLDEIYVDFNDNYTEDNIKSCAIRCVQQLMFNNNVNGNKVIGIGIAAHGLVNTQEKIVSFAPNFGLKNLNLGEAIEDEFQVPVYIENDVRAMAIGESWFGLGRSISDFVCLKIGHGIGASFFINNGLYRGVSEGAGEIGHTTIDVDGPRCACGNFGCLQAMASESRIIDRVKEGINKGYCSILECQGDFTSKDVNRAAHMGDLLSAKVLNEVGMYLGVGVANIINSLNPRLVILGGEIATYKKYVIKSLMDTVKRKVLQDSYKNSEIVISDLEPYSSVKGAALYVIDNYMKDFD
ncbi:MAG: ROK family transcriptional regulator [Clostridia bacterium]|nr:ROK family transcriptional regulator [Clostridia bacterium]